MLIYIGIDFYVVLLEFLYEKFLYVFETIYGSLLIIVLVHDFMFVQIRISKELLYVIMFIKLFKLILCILDK